jgi:hypothetical protein
MVFPACVISKVLWYSLPQTSQVAIAVAPYRINQPYRRTAPSKGCSRQEITRQLALAGTSRKAKEAFGRATDLTARRTPFRFVLAMSLHGPRADLNAIWQAAGNCLLARRPPTSGAAMIEALLTAGNL